MDNMYLTIRQACKQAIRAQITEGRTHIVFMEAGLWRIKPADEIAEIDQRAIYGWTVAPIGQKAQRSGEITQDGCKPFAKIRRQFYKGECYYDPENNIRGLKTHNRYSRSEIYDIIRNGQQFDER